MVISKAEIYNLLYTNESGEVVGLDEVQFLDTPPKNRIPHLIQLLSNEDFYISYQSALILTAWGIKEGIVKIEEFIDNKIHLLGSVEPHRIYGDDNVYDVIAEAIHLYWLRGGNKEKVLMLYKKLLKLYPSQYFEGRFSRALMKSSSTLLLNDLVKALLDTFSNGKIFQSSLLLPVISKLDSNKGLELIKKFQPFKSTQPDPMENVADALKFIHTDISKPMLLELVSSENELVANKAKISLEVLQRY